jgi:Na+-driven multidrug efflux pump
LPAAQDIVSLVFQFRQTHGAPAQPLLCLALNIMLNVLFIPLWGSRGAAFASTLSYILYGVYYLCLMRYSESFSFRSLLKPRRADLQILSRLIKGGTS